MTIKIKKGISILLTSVFLFSGMFSASLQAKMFSTEQAQNQYNKTYLQEALARDEVQKKLAAMGVDAQQIQERVDNLSTEEIAQLNQYLDELPAGADGLGTVVFIFVVFVITDMLGATDVFPFVNKIN